MFQSHSKAKAHAKNADASFELETQFKAGLGAVFKKKLNNNKYSKKN